MSELLAENARLRDALIQIMDELGIPSSDYAAPVANAHQIACDALNRKPSAAQTLEAQQTIKEKGSS